MKRQLLENGDDILMNASMDELPQLNMSFQEAYDTLASEIPSSSGKDPIPPLDLVERFQKGEDITLLLEKNKEGLNVIPGVPGDIQNQALGILQSGLNDFDKENEPQMVDDSHWKMQQMELDDKSRKRRNKIEEQLEKTFADKNYWDDFTELSEPKPPKIASLKVTQHSGCPYNDDDLLPDVSENEYAKLRPIRYDEYEFLIKPSWYAPFGAMWPKGRTYDRELVAQAQDPYSDAPKIFLVFTKEEKCRPAPSFRTLFHRYGKQNVFMSPSRTLLEEYPEDRKRAPIQPMEGIQEEEEEEEEKKEQGQEQETLVEQQNEPTAVDGAKVPEENELEKEPSLQGEQSEAQGQCIEDVAFDDFEGDLLPVEVEKPEEARKEEEEDEAFGRRYKIKQSRINAPLVKKAIAAILANSDMEDTSRDRLNTPPEPTPPREEPKPGPSNVITFQMPDGIVLLKEIKEEQVDEEVVEEKPIEDPEKELEAMKIRVSDFPVVGHHTFSNLLARLPSVLSKQSVEDLKPSNALTILLHMCNENKLYLPQHRDKTTNAILESSLDDFLIRSTNSA
ncbi:hypothetical protein L596_003783 [Steinernema carpocapsae]|uniref:Condensin complex subunit 2 n=1 Tax=Steinernema carpocapsae TaxID=34508 RepID=A0A4U8UTU1_STECR|nr:hypothetical protein L596_003783 [Steinernema carpocapsae]